MVLERVHGQVRSFPFTRCKRKLIVVRLACAVVTGASEGIGREFALQLAKKGFNVLVAARNATALSALTSEIGEHSVMFLPGKN